MIRGSKNNFIGVISQGRFVRAASLFSGARVVGGFLGLIRSALTARIMGPEAFGVWNFITLFETFSTYTSLGTHAGASRRIPFLRGRGKVNELTSVLNTAFITNFFCIAVYSAAAFIYSFFIEQPFNAKALAVYSPVILLLGWLKTAKTLSMSMGLYGLRSKLELLFDVLTALSSIGLVYFWGVYGIIAGFGISALITLLIAARKLLHQLAFEIDWRILWELILTGFPVMANGALHTVMGTVDRILIASMLSNKTLGIYGVANIGVRILTIIPIALGQMLFVKFAEMDGQKKPKEYMSDVLDATAIVLSCLSAPLISIIIACFPIAVVFMLPQYVEGIAAGKFLIASVFFISISLPYTNWYISTGRFIPVLTLKFIIIAAELISIYIIIHNSASLKLIALCVLCAFAVYVIALIMMCNNFFGKSFNSSMVRAGKTLLPFLSIFMAIAVQEQTYQVSDTTLDLRLLISCITSLTVSLVVSIPFIFWVHKRTRILDLIWTSMDKWLRK